MDLSKTRIPKYLKNCPECKSQMKLRDGKFGVFLYCGNMVKCNQKTISVEFKESHPTSTPYYEILRDKMDEYDKRLYDEINEAGI